MTARLTYSYVKSYIEGFGYKLLSTEYKNNNTKLKVQCNKEHIYEVKFHNFKRTKCPYCSHKKVNYEQVKAIVEEAGYKLISKEYKNQQSKIKVECVNGHRTTINWKGFLKKVKANHGCRKCVDDPKKFTYEYVKEKIEESDCKLLSETYKDVKSKLEIECNKGHKFSINFEHFRKKPVCRKCTKHNEYYPQVKSYVEELGYSLVSKTCINHRSKLDLICSKGHFFQRTWRGIKLSSDCPYCINRKTHYKDVKAFVNSIGYKLLSKEYKNSESDLLIECNKGHLYTTKLPRLKNSNRCPYCSGRIVTYQNVKKTIEESGYKLLSSEYKNANSKLVMLCPNNHIYKASWSSFYSGYRCGRCSGAVFTIDDVRKEFESIGYKLLSTKYKNAHAKIKIECPMGHQYTTTRNTFKRSNGCSKCNNSTGGFSDDKPGYLYYSKIFFGDENYYKIGITNNNPTERIYNINKDAVLLWSRYFLDGGIARKKERRILDLYKKFLIPEDIPLLKSGYTETFLKDVLKKDVNF